MSLETNKFEFGDFCLETKEKILSRHGKPISLTPKALQLLLILVENHGRIVEKETLMQKIWADSFVEESNLTFTVSLLRKTLGDKPDSRFIETVPKRGYRFIAEVRRNAIENENLRVESESNGNRTSPVIFPQPIIKREKPRSGTVVALADWRHETNKAEQESAVSATETANNQLSQPEAFLPNPFAENKSGIYLYILAGFLGVAAIVGFGYGFYLLNGESEKTSDDSRQTATRLTASGSVRFAVAAPDGKSVAYVQEENERQSFWLKNIATGSNVQIPLPEDTVRVNSLVFSPDGNHLYYDTKDVLYKIPVFGGAPQKILENYNGNVQKNAISFSPDGKQFAFIRNSSEDLNSAVLVIADANGGSERVLAESRRPENFLRSAAWSPDGKKIACAAMTAAGIQQIVAVNVSDGMVSPVSSLDWDAVLQIVWRADGNGFFVVAQDDDATFLSQIWSVSYPYGEARNITNDSNDYQNISLTADKEALVAVRAEQDAHLWVASADGANRAKKLTAGFQKFDGVAGINWTADGKIIYESAPGGKSEVWRVEIDGRDLKQLTDKGGMMSASPDGKFLVYQSEDAAGTGLFRQNWSDGEIIRLTNGADIDPAFSPDGKWIVFTRYADDAALWKVSIDGGEAVKLTNFAGYALYPTVSPDGKYIAFYRQSADNAPPFWVIGFEDGKIVKTFAGFVGIRQGNGKITLQWTADGQALDYAVHRNGVSNLWRQSLDGSPPVQLTNFETELIFNFAASPDGKQYALSRGTFERDAVLISNLGK